MIAFGKSIKESKLANEKRAEEEAKAAKREADKALKAATAAAKKAAEGSAGGSATTEVDETKSVFDQFKSAQAGNADDIVSRLRQRQAAGKEKEGHNSVNNELAAKLLLRKSGK